MNITYKILANGAVAMTGGQPIEGESHRGRDHGARDRAPARRRGRARGSRSRRTRPTKYRGRGAFPAGVTFHHRDQLDRVQRELRDVPGVSALIYDQTCAAEARRLRKRGEFPDPDERVVINELRLRGLRRLQRAEQLHLDRADRDRVRPQAPHQPVELQQGLLVPAGPLPELRVGDGGRLRTAGSRAASAATTPRFAALPEPAPPDLEQPWNVLVTGIGGSGVITVGALIGMAAHLEGKGCSVLDVTGLAQKNGPVTSHVRVAARPERSHATRIAAGAADLVIGCDIVVDDERREPREALAAGAPRRSSTATSHRPSSSRRNPDLDLSSRAHGATRSAAAAGDGACDFVAATRLATALLGDAIFTNPFLMGFALQRGRLPVGRAALERAIELNGRAVDARTSARSPGAGSPPTTSPPSSAPRGRALRESPARRSRGDARRASSRAAPRS